MQGLMTYLVIADRVFAGLDQLQLSWRARLLKGIDIRKHGSGNAGATNTLRVLGVGPGIAVLLLDVMKGIAAVLIGQAASGGSPLVAVLCGLRVITGHNWPVFFGFRGRQRNCHDDRRDGDARFLACALTPELSRFYLSY